VTYVNRTKEKLKAGQPAFGFGLGLASPIATEMLAGTPIDFLMVDNQHGSFGADATIACFMAISTGSATPVARVARNDYTMVGRLLDEGCMGIVFPMVHTREDAKQAADFCRLPPVGTRSWGWGRAARYGADYPDWINEQVLVMVQIESIQAVENAEAIMSVEGVDGCWLGPGDMALSMGIDPRKAAGDERHVAATERVLQACRNTGKAAGFACNSTEEARERADKGWQFLTAGSDIGFLLEGAAGALRTLRVG
jgi:4-hydroxy-2-oxoheptanedioate aldolase